MANGNFTFSCPHCGQHLEAEPDMVGMEFDCPGCGKVLAVPQPELGTSGMSSFQAADGSADGSLATSEVSGTAAPEAASGDAFHPGPAAAASPPAISVVKFDDATVTPPPIITVVKKREGFFEKNKKWLIPVACCMAALLLAVRVKMPRRNDTQSRPNTPKTIIPANRPRSAFDSLTRSEQLAIGKVVYMWAQFWSVQNKISEYARYGNSSEAAAAGIAGVVVAAMLPRVDDRGAPEDFRRAWRAFVPLLAASNAGDGLFSLASAGLSSGYQPSLQDVVGLLRANQNLEDVKDEAEIALINFLRVLQRYGLEDVFRVANEVGTKVDSGVWSMNDFLRK